MILENVLICGDVMKLYSQIPIALALSFSSVNVNDLPVINDVPKIQSSAFSCSPKNFKDKSQQAKLIRAFNATVYVEVLNEDGNEISHGSGFVIDDKEGLIITNEHVVSSDNATLKVTMYESNRKDNLGESYMATVVGKDKNSDLAVLKVDPQYVQSCLNFSQKEKDQYLGEKVYAIGHPYVNPFSLSEGSVSNTNRYVPKYPFDVLQTDAAINPGNSGGALLSKDMEVIGVNSSIWTVNNGNLGIGFAIPFNVVSMVADDIIRNGYSSHGWSGLELKTLNKKQLKKLGVDCGVLVSETPEASTPAEKAGLVKTDIITAINGIPVKDKQDIKRILFFVPKEKMTELDVFRMGEKIKLGLHIGDKKIYDDQIAQAKIKADELIKSVQIHASNAKLLITHP